MLAEFESIPVLGRPEAPFLGLERERELCKQLITRQGHASALAAGLIQLLHPMQHRLGGGDCRVGVC
jgi:hypothetical protein